MQYLSFDKQLLIFLNEVLDKRRLFAVTFSIISITILIVGLSWPKSYESSTTLLWNKANVLRPLLEGTVETNTGQDQSRIAKEVIYSNKNIGILIEKTGLNYSSTGAKLSDREIEVLKARLRGLILVELKKNKTLKISYTNANPDLAFLVVSVISQLFVEESTSNKRTDSLEAYNFIDKQVNEYREKLEGITNRINKFKSENAELQVDTARSVNNRVSNLKQKVSASSILLKEAIIQKESLIEQLVIEAAKSTIVEEVNIKNERLLILNDQLNILRLSYTEDYPDIVQIKEQIKNLTRSLEENAFRQPGSADTSSLDEGGLGRGVKAESLLYQQLQQQLSAIEITVKTLSARKNDQEKQLVLEMERSSEVMQVFNRLKELSLDYDVTKRLYDSLLTERENAQVSLNLENENAGSLYVVQEPPTIPLIPQGLRFLHFVLASIIVGVGMPLAITFGLLLIDPRIHHEDDLILDDAIPVIGIIPDFRSLKDLKKQRFITIQAVILFSLSFGVVVTLSLSRYYEVI